MADTTWPTTLRDLWLKDSFQETPPNNMIRTEMDAGPAKVRRRTTSNVRLFQGKLFLTKTLVATLDTFFVTSTVSGTLTIALNHPRTKVAGTYRFVSEPQYTRYDSGWVATIQLELLP